MLDITDKEKRRYTKKAIYILANQLDDLESSPRIKLIKKLFITYINSPLDFPENKKNILISNLSANIHYFGNGNKAIIELAISVLKDNILVSRLVNINLLNRINSRTNTKETGRVLPSLSLFRSCSNHYENVNNRFKLGHNHKFILSLSVIFRTGCVDGIPLKQFQFVNYVNMLLTEITQLSYREGKQFIINFNLHTMTCDNNKPLLAYATKYGNLTAFNLLLTCCNQSHVEIIVDAFQESLKCNNIYMVLSLVNRLTKEDQDLSTFTYFQIIDTAIQSNTDPRIIKFLLERNAKIEDIEGFDIYINQFNQHNTDVIFCQEKLLDAKIRVESKIIHETLQFINDYNVDLIKWITTYLYELDSDFEAIFSKETIDLLKQNKTVYDDEFNNYLNNLCRLNFIKEPTGLAICKLYANGVITVKPHQFTAFIRSYYNLIQDPHILPINCLLTHNTRLMDDYLTLDAEFESSFYHTTQQSIFDFAIHQGNPNMLTLLYGWFENSLSALKIKPISLLKLIKLVYQLYAEGKEKEGLFLKKIGEKFHVSLSISFISVKFFAYKEGDARLMNIIDGIAKKMSSVDIESAAFIYVATYGYLEFCQFYLMHNINVNVIDENTYSTALFNAAGNGHLKVCKLLLEYKADPNITDHEQFSPLMNAALNGHSSIVNLLIENQADLDLQDIHSKTALHYAVIGGNKDCVQLLCDAGANLDIIDEQKCTPLDEAHKQNNQSLIHILQEVIASKTNILKR